LRANCFRRSDDRNTPSPDEFPTLANECQRKPFRTYIITKPFTVLAAEKLTAFLELEMRGNNPRNNRFVGEL
jgi:hypothetical protein